MNWLGKRLWRLRVAFVLVVMISSLPHAVFAQNNSNSSAGVSWPLVITNKPQGFGDTARFTFVNSTDGTRAERSVNGSLLPGIAEIFAGVFRPQQNQVLLLAFLDKNKFPQSLVITYTITRGTHSISAFAIQDATLDDRRSVEDAYNAYAESKVRGLPLLDLRYFFGRQRLNGHPVAFMRGLVFMPGSLSQPPQRQPTAPPAAPVRPSPSPAPPPPAPQPPASPPCPQCQTIKILCGAPTRGAGLSSRQFSNHTAFTSTSNLQRACTDSMFVRRFSGHYCELCLSNGALADKFNSEGWCGKVITREEFRQRYSRIRNALTPALIDQALKTLSGNELIGTIVGFFHLLQEVCMLADENSHLENDRHCLEPRVCDERRSTRANRDCHWDKNSELIVQKLLAFLADNSRFPPPNELRKQRNEVTDYLTYGLCWNKTSTELNLKIEECICCESSEGKLTQNTCELCVKNQCDPSKSARDPLQQPLKPCQKDAIDGVCTSFFDADKISHTCPSYIKDQERYLRYRSENGFLTSPPPTNSDNLSCQACVCEASSAEGRAGQVILGRCRAPRAVSDCGASTCLGTFDQQGKWNVVTPCKSTEGL